MSDEKELEGGNVWFVGEEPDEEMTIFDALVLLALLAVSTAVSGMFIGWVLGPFFN